jgi:glycosyltransferase involved in cell wall biosynthesis
MKIALFHNLPPGGAKRALFEHAKALRQRGHRLDAYTTSVAAENFLPLAPYCDNVYTYDAPARESTQHLPGPLQKVHSFLTGYRVAIKVLEQWEQLYRGMAMDIERRGYDLVYAHNCRVLQSPHLLYCLKLPTLYYCQDSLRYFHEWSLHTPEDYDRVRVPVGKVKFHGHIVTETVHRIWEACADRDTLHARSADRVLVNSFYSREVMVREYGINPHVCYLGVDTDYFSPTIPFEDRRQVVVGVGAIGEHKRYDFLIDAVGQIPQERRPPLEIYGYDLIGQEGEESTLLKQLRVRAAKQNVELTVHRDVTDDLIRDAYQKAGVVAFVPQLEPFGFIPLEAMACGAPVVGIAEGGVRESIVRGETGLLIERDPQQFGEALDTVLNDKRQARRISEQGRENVCRCWTWQHSTDRLIEQMMQLPQVSAT